ncbi:hypothetical protein M409DRAFT_22234 [Zasmidium cellare ATCC 36951]|uniref:Uncharacterized protein n=1 Tax=Zasmidium cellare ATCC 36951 TaxID=1080233 RepID=A0A6A6CJU2_ZASCE|nr:uncharacterized protein M409DRAFT_22234 [Zasmidium cellare ATCC 36951]KAF2167425.1 hypothetical protein M409DRAFT_22234 [Zasmidium cellare ATCC 36951]
MSNSRDGKMASGKNEKNSKTTLVTMPQELLDNIIRLALPAALLVKAHDYVSLDLDDDPESINGFFMELDSPWREVVGIRLLHSKIKKAVDESITKINTLDITVIDHISNTVFDAAASRPFGKCLQLAQWMSIIQKQEINTIVVGNEHMELLAFDDAGGRFTLQHVNDGWRLQRTQWTRNACALTASSLVPDHFERERAFHTLMVLWSKEGLSAATVSLVIKATTLGSQCLCLQSWAPTGVGMFGIVAYLRSKMEWQLMAMEKRKAGSLEFEDGEVVVEG